MKALLVVFFLAPCSSLPGRVATTSLVDDASCASLIGDRVQRVADLGCPVILATCRTVKESPHG